jgi:hypothetical protein
MEFPIISITDLFENRSILTPGRSEKIYPLKKYLTAGVKLTVNTDDPGISRTNLSREYRKVARRSEKGCFFPVSPQILEIEMFRCHGIQKLSESCLSAHSFSEQNLHLQYHEHIFPVIEINGQIGAPAFCVADPERAVRYAAFVVGVGFARLAVFP